MPDKRTREWKCRMTAADVYDCYSLKAAEKAGYGAVYLSADAVAECVCGLDQTNQMSLEEYLWMAKRAASFTELPMIAQMKSGFGNQPEDAALSAMRLAKAGADAVWIDDSAFQKTGSRISEEAWKLRVKKVKEAVQDCSCKVICTITSGWEELGHAAARCNAAREQGADLVGICGIQSTEELNQYTALVPGPKVWIVPEAEDASGKRREGRTEDTIESGREDKRGKRSEDVTETAAGMADYELILDCYSVKSAKEGMELFGRKTQKDRNTVFHDQHDFDGMLPSRSHYDLFEFYKLWIPMEQHFMDAAAADETE